MIIKNIIIIFHVGSMLALLRKIIIRGVAILRPVLLKSLVVTIYIILSRLLVLSSLDVQEVPFGQ